jgi:hypothetical protein
MVFTTNFYINLLTYRNNSLIFACVTLDYLKDKKKSICRQSASSGGVWMKSFFGVLFYLDNHGCRVCMESIHAKYGIDQLEQEPSTLTKMGHQTV